MCRLLTALLIVCFVALPMAMTLAMPAAQPQGQASMAADHHDMAPAGNVTGNATGHAGHCDENSSSDVDMSMCCHMSAAHCGGVFQTADAWRGASPTDGDLHAAPAPTGFQLGHIITADPPPPRG